MELETKCCYTLIAKPNHRKMLVKTAKGTDPSMSAWKSIYTMEEHMETRNMKEYDIGRYTVTPQRENKQRGEIKDMKRWNECQVMSPADFAYQAQRMYRI